MKREERIKLKRLKNQVERLKKLREIYALDYKKNQKIEKEISKIELIIFKMELINNYETIGNSKKI